MITNLPTEPAGGPHLTGSAEPSMTAAITATVMRNDARRCKERLRKGSPVAATAMVTASCVTG